MTDFPPEAKELLSESAQKRIARAIDAGNKARREAERAFSRHDEESQLALSAASFDFAFSVMSVTLDELQAGGIFGEQLREIMAQEIEAIVNGLELGDAGEKQLRDLLIENDFGW